MSTTPPTRNLRSWLALLATGLGLALMACSAPSEDRGVDAVPADGSRRGKLIEDIATFEDGTSRTTYYLRTGLDERSDRELVLSTAPDILPSTEVNIWGVEKDGRIWVDKLEPARAEQHGLGSISQGLIGATAIEPTKLAMVIVDTGGGTNITPEELQKRLFTNPDATRQYYLENSFGMHDLQGKVVSKVLSYPMSSCDTRGMSMALKAQIDEDVGGPSQIYLWYIGQRTTLCSWSGLSSGVNTFYNGSSSCVVLVQEPGHSFGLAHSSRLACTEGGKPVPFLDNAQQCTHNEYGNSFDTMGGGCRHFSSYHKVYRQYLQKCNGVNVKSSGTFTLHAIEKACNGVQVLQVPFPGNKTRSFMSSGGGSGDRTTALAYYLVELRAPLGYDTGLKPTVLINVAPKYTVYNPAGGRTRGEHIWLLDMATDVTAGRDGAAFGLAAGKTFADPAGGVNITTLEVNAEWASIKVEIDGSTESSTCLDDSPITGPGPNSCGDEGGVIARPEAGAAVDASRADAKNEASSGSAGAGGSGGVAGSGGGVSSTTGSGGVGGTLQGEPEAGGGPPGRGAATGPSDVEGGCACRTHASPASPPPWSIFGLSALALVGRARRRYRRVTRRTCFF